MSVVLKGQDVEVTYLPLSVVGMGVVESDFE
jgi:hypothetical protein